MSSNISKTLFDANLAELNATKAKLFNICTVYKKARPVLTLAKKILFFKPKLSALIGLLIETLDTICES